jgi:hypothetical protein
MKIEFACPECGSRFAVAPVHAGKTIACKRCGQPIAIPGVPATEPLDVAVASSYALEPATDDAPSTFSPARAASIPIRQPMPEPATSGPFWLDSPRSPRKKKKPGAGVLPSWWKRAAGSAAVAVVVMVLVSWLVPKGSLIVGFLLIGIGTLLFLAGFFVGAFGAFSEDFVTGMLYLFIPLFTGYYIVTRWDDLKPWFITLSVGVGLVSIGGWVLEGALEPPAATAEATAPVVQG